MEKKFYLVTENLENTSNKLAEEGKTPMYVAIEGKLARIIVVADTVKENSKKAIEYILSSVSVIANALRLKRFKLAR